MNVYNQPQYQFDLLLHIYNGTIKRLVHLDGLNNNPILSNGGGDYHTVHISYYTVHI